MIVHDVEQGTDDWLTLRLGLPTASCFGQIVLPPANKEKWRCGSPDCKVSHTAENSAAKCKGGNGKPEKYIDVSVKRSESFKGYMLEVLAEEMSGVPLESFKSDWMKRGNEFEAQAKGVYSIITDRELEEPGFITNDAATVGCSPDAMGLEVKCPAPRTHMGYLLKNVCPPTYFPQVQGCMYICEKEEWDFMSYYPTLPPMIVTVKRDDNYIKELDSALKDFLKDMKTARKQIEDSL